MYYSTHEIRTQDTSFWPNSVWIRGIPLYTYPTWEMTHLKRSGRWLAAAHTSSPPLDPPWIASLHGRNQEERGMHLHVYTCSLVPSLSHSGSAHEILEAWSWSFHTYMACSDKTSVTTCRPVLIHEHTYNELFMRDLVLFFHYIRTCNLHVESMFILIRKVTHFRGLN